MVIIARNKTMLNILLVNANIKNNYKKYKCKFYKLFDYFTTLLLTIELRL